MFPQPDGKRNSVEEHMLPDLEATVTLYAAHMRKVGPEWSYPPHRHALFELNLVLEGKQRMTVGGKTVIQEEGDILLLVSGEKHRADVEGNAPMAYFCLHFDVSEPAFRQRLARAPSTLFGRDTDAGRALSGSMSKMLELTRGGGRPGPQMSIRVLSALFDICSALGEELERSAGPERPFRHPFVREMAALLEESVLAAGGKSQAPKGSVADLARRFGYSAAYCNRLFHETYGLSPRQYLSRLKLSEAKKMLLDSETAVSDIAAKLGYRDMAHLSRQFKRWTGMSPTEYRQSIHGNELKKAVTNASGRQP